MTAYFLDTETTGLKEAEVIELAWLRVANGAELFGPNPDLIPPDLRIEEEHSSRYCPEKPTTFGALAVHHILPSEVVGLPPSASAVLPADCGYVIGHSVDHDWRALGAPERVKRICTKAMAEHCWPDADSHGQVALIYQLLGPTPETRALVKNAHSALADVQLNRRLLNYILLDKNEIKTWSALWEFSEEARIPLTCPMKKYEGVPLPELDRGFVFWCLEQPWFEEQYPYFKKGLLRVLENDRNE